MKRKRSVRERERGLYSADDAAARTDSRPHHFHQAIHKIRIEREREEEKEERERGKIFTRLSLSLQINFLLFCERVLRFKMRDRRSSAHFVLSRETLQLAPPLPPPPFS